jgi:hypothetical protein
VCILLLVLELLASYIAKKSEILFRRKKNSKKQQIIFPEAISMGKKNLKQSKTTKTIKSQPSVFFFFIISNQSKVYMIKAHRLNGRSVS